MSHRQIKVTPSIHLGALEYFPVALCTSDSFFFKKTIFSAVFAHKSNMDASK